MDEINSFFDLVVYINITEKESLIRKLGIRNYQDKQFHLRDFQPPYGYSPMLEHLEKETKDGILFKNIDFEKNLLPIQNYYQQFSMQFTPANLKVRTWKEVDGC